MKVAIVGTGNVARKSYLPYLSNVKDIDLLLFSRTREKAEACAAEYGGQAVGSIEELLAAGPDTILVLTKETQRFEVAGTLLAGRPRRVFFEKPLVAQNGQDQVCEEDFFKARDLLGRARAADTETAMVFNYRFFDLTRRARTLVAERKLGVLRRASLFVHYACWSHCIDLLRLFGGRAVRLTALSAEGAGNGSVDVAGAFRLETGATGTIIGTGRSPIPFPLYDLLLQFERGQLRFADLDGTLDILEEGSRYRETVGLIGHHSRWDQYQDSFEKALEAYLDSVRKGAPPPVPGLAGLEELQFEAALRRSIAQQRPVDVQGEFPLDG